MRNIVTLFLLLISTFGYAQEIPLSAVKKVQELNVSDADAYITSLGFKKSKNESQRKLDTYSYEKIAKKPEDSLKFEKLVFNNRNVGTILTFYTIKYFSKIKASISKSGYKRISKKGANGNIVYEYQKGAHLISLGIYRAGPTEKFHYSVEVYSKKNLQSYINSKKNNGFASIMSQIFFMNLVINK